MAVNYTIQADVVDIRTDTPKANDVLMVDTNVWYWLTYTRATQADNPPASHQINHYPNYIKKALSAKSTLVQSTLNLTELMHLIEKTEIEIYAKSSGFDKTRRKEYRHNLASQRSIVVSEIDISWNQISSFGIPIQVSIDEKISECLAKRMHTNALDGYDLLITETMTRANVNQVITDDGDFTTVQGLQVFTCNSNVLTAARQQGRLITR